MTAAEIPREAAQRIRDTLGRLDQDTDLWLATANGGEPWLVPLSFHWTGTALLMVTLRRSRTYRNIAAGGGARVTVGCTRDVVMLDGRWHAEAD
jgi:nitroimidazol reductase NimA-like FMN-containing flavoprotein (pyridoxamine 5'-phosphate oxidase superfamily)